MEVCEYTLDGEVDAPGDVGSGWALYCCNDALHSVKEDSISSGWVTTERALTLRIHTCLFLRRRRQDAAFNYLQLFSGRLAVTSMSRIH